MNRTKGHPLDCAITSESCVPKSFGNILVRTVKKSITRSCRSIAPHKVTTCRLVKENRTKQMLAKVDQDNHFSNNDRKSHHPKKRNHHEMEASWREICLSMHRGTFLSKIEYLGSSSVNSSASGIVGAYVALTTAGETVGSLERRALTGGKRRSGIVMLRLLQ
jgi:hypothetical protein